MSQLVLPVGPRDHSAGPEDGRYESRVCEDFAGGVRSGVNGTPTFFINGVRYDGSWDQLLETLTAVAQR